VDFGPRIGHIDFMFERIFGRPRKPAANAARVPDGSRIYAIGDIHGRLDLLRKLHGIIGEDVANFAGQRKVLVYLGDYVDRGLQSRETVDYLLEDPLPGFERVFLMGNHERALLDFLADPRVALDWMTYGGDATLYSYGVGIEGPRTQPATLAKAQEKFRANLPESHWAFYQSLALTHAEGDYVFVHAGLRPGVPIERQQEKDVLWIRDEFLDSEENFGKVVVHGHSITRVPEVKKNRIGIDTGAFASDKLTCLVLEGETGRFLDTVD
jgi:serine/threonine protein phosphatase 1